MIICLDPGHGGRDPGCSNSIIREKDITLTICLQLKALLEKAGFTVVLTRDTDIALGADVNSDLHARCAISDNAKADVFLSVHVNAGGGMGAEIFVYQDGGSIQPLAKGIVDNVAAVMGYHGQPVKDGSDLYVIRNTQAPSMLVEIGFIDSNDLAKIQAYINQFAGFISKAFCDFYNVKEALPMDPQPVDQVSDWAKSAWEKAIKKRIIKGDGKVFNPQANVSREALVVILDRLGYLD